MTQSADLPDLAPCPFCGERHTQIVRRPWKGTKSFETFVLCGPCQITGPSSVARDMEETCKANAIKLWNTRTPAAGVVERLEALKAKTHPDAGTRNTWNAAIDAAIEAVKNGG